MKEKDIILKWLNHEKLSAEEQEKFSRSEHFSSYEKISRKALNFKSPQYNKASEFNALSNKMKTSNNSLSNKKALYTFLKIAAVLIICIGIYFAIPTNSNTEIETLVSETKEVLLPDQSQVRLNALSTISYDTENWNVSRKVELEGEAYFKVEKGSKFDVHTDQGVISVLGTRFNVKNRGSFLQVECYEGVVSVTKNNETLYLREFESVIYRNSALEKKPVGFDMPSWFENRSLFYSRPMKEVIEELEWQYGVKVNLRNIDENTLFTGNFVHSDLKIALASIAVPLNLKYKISGDTITFVKE